MSTDFGCPDNDTASEFHLRAVPNDGLAVVGIAKTQLKIKANTSGMSDANGSALQLAEVVS